MSTNETNSNPTDVRTASVADRLYKFYTINDNLLSTIESNYLWFSQAKDFNDPFDCYGELIYYQASKDAITDLVNSKINQPRAARRKQIRDLSKRPKAFVGAFENTRQEVIDSQGICCFSKNRDSTLMWSHYANYHKGICLEFDYKQIRNAFTMSEVKYESEFKSSNYFENKHNSLLHLFTTKSIEWKYEMEFRAVDDRKGKIRFPKQALVGVTFGCKATTSNIDSVIQKLHQSNYLNVELQQAVMQKRSFELVFIKHNNAI